MASLASLASVRRSRLLPAGRGGGGSALCLPWAWLQRSVGGACAGHAQGQQPTTNWVLPTGTATDIFVRNSFTKQKEPLVLATPGVVSWYQCGPTVYAATHIGHACTYVRFDIIRRLLTDHFK